LEESARSSLGLSKKPIELMSSRPALTPPGHSTLYSPRNGWFANWPAQAGGVMVVKRRNSIEGQWVPHRIEMLRSPAWSVLSLSARRVLNRIEIEHADHGGNDNGRLPVTYDDFECYGIHRHAIRAAIQETVALGFVEITERGRAGNAEFRSPHKFRLTYLHVGRAPPTNEWQRVETVEEAQALAKAARQEAPQKTKVQWRKTPNFSGGNRHRKRQFQSAETTTTRLSADSTTTSISRGGRASQADRR
jgi:hypothetical protein